MKISLNVLFVTFIVPLLLGVATAGAYSLSATPPASRPAMSLDMLPPTPVPFLNGLVATWNSAPESAMALWNQTGIGPGLDHGFFFKTPPALTGDPCSADGVNEVRFASTECGLAFGDALAVTIRRSTSGRTIERDMLFDANRNWNVYSGPLRQASTGGWLYDIYRVALHEMGHAAGLNHPDDAGQTVASIMNSRVSDTYTLQPDDIAGAHAIAWGTASQSPTTDAVEYYDAAWNFYFVTSFPDEIAALDAGAFGGAWRRTGQAFKAWNQSSASNSPTCRFFSTSFAPKSSHFYTPFPTECALIKVRAGWQYEAIAFYLQLASDAGACPSETAPLFRLYNNGMGGAPNHRYTTSLTVFNQMLAAGWVFEGNSSTKVFACVPQ